MQNPNNKKIFKARNTQNLTKVKCAEEREMFV